MENKDVGERACMGYEAMFCTLACQSLRCSEIRSVMVPWF